MIPPQDILNALFQTFDLSARDDFKKFLSGNAGITKWHIAADFCLHDSDRPNDVFALSVIPYDDYHHNLFAEIREALPKDIKKTRDIPAKSKAFLVDPRRFHFAFVLRNPPDMFNNGPGSDRLSVARACVDLILEGMIKQGRSQENVEKIRELRRKSLSNGFNVELLADMFMLSHLLSFVTIAIVRDNPATVVGWFSDRDSMTQWCNGVLWDIAGENVRGLAEHFSVRLPKNCPSIAIPTPIESVGADSPPNAGAVNPMWFDEFVRIPDYIAGILAAWKFDTNELPQKQKKYIELAEEVITPAKNMAVITIKYTDGFQAGRTVFSREPFASSLAC